LNKLCILFSLLLALLIPKTYAISPTAHIALKAPRRANSAKIEAYSEEYLKGLVAKSQYPQILDKIIPCESQWTNIARIDSNGKMSYGILQFQQTTWDFFAPLAGISSTPMNPTSAIEVATYMISHNQLHRWTCAKIEHLI